MLLFDLAISTKAFLQIYWGGYSGATPFFGDLLLSMSVCLLKLLFITPDKRVIDFAASLTLCLKTAGIAVYITTKGYQLIKNGGNKGIRSIVYRDAVGGVFGLILVRRVAARRVWDS